MAVIFHTYLSGFMGGGEMITMVKEGRMNSVQLRVVTVGALWSE